MTGADTLLEIARLDQQAAAFDARAAAASGRTKFGLQGAAARARRERKNIMDANTTPPGNGMVLTAAITLRSPELAAACGRSDGIVPRGAKVPPEALASCRNGSALLAAGALRWQPPAPPPREVRSAPPAAPPPVPVAPRDWFAECASALALLLRDGVQESVAEDRIDINLRLRSLVHYCSRAGQPPGRRSADGFREALLAEARALAAQGAAA
jgi:hypothetical protein